MSWCVLSVLRRETELGSRLTPRNVKREWFQDLGKEGVAILLSKEFELFRNETDLVAGFLVTSDWENEAALGNVWKYHYVSHLSTDLDATLLLSDPLPWSRPGPYHRNRH